MTLGIMTPSITVLIITLSKMVLRITSFSIIALLHQNNNTQHNGLNCEAKHKVDIQHYDI
jgi:hypothetical protein